MKQGWEVKKLGEVLVKTEMVDPAKKPDDEFTYIDVSSVNKETKEIESASCLLGKDAPSRARKIVKTNDVIFATVRPTHSRVAIITDDYDGQICSTGYFVFRGKENIENKYLFYFLLTDNFNKQMEKLQKGASYPAVTDAEVKSIFLQYPKSLPEQQRIVAILDESFAGINRAKEIAEQNLRNAREIFESYLQGVFENGDWETKTIEEVCEEIYAGGDAPKNNFSLEPNEKHKIPIFANAVKERGLYGFTDYARVNKPCVTISARGSGTGHTELRNEPFFPIVRLIVCIPDTKQISTEFLKYTIDNLVIQRSGSAIPQLTVPMIMEYQIPVPTIEKQIQLIEKAETLQAETQKLEVIYNQKLKDLEELKKSVLQKAFNGELN
jgi:type I restriction enzyme S subunit